MSSFINNGLSGLLAAQRALQVTSNNVANSMTDGYVRQRVEFAERPSTVSGGNLSIGNGVGISAINRVYDQFIADELKDANSAQRRAQLVSDLASRVDNLLGNPDSGISQGVQAFFSQAENLNRDPSSQVNRQQLISEGQSLAQRFGQLDTQLGQIGGEVNGRLQEGVNRINGIAESLAQVNDRIAAASGTPNELLDEQERLLTELSTLVNFTAVRQANGGLNVMVGSGQPLVLNNVAEKLDLVQNEFDGSRMEVSYKGRSISSMITGGEVAGLLAFRTEVLDPARQELGQLALGITEVFNAQHRQGMDLNGQIGGDFFASVQPAGTASANNTGTGTATVTIGNAAAIQPRDYLLRFNGSGWELMDARTQAPVTMGGNGTAGNPFTADGLEIVVGPGAASGDRFLISAVRPATTDVAVVLTDPRGIAAANPLATRVGPGNLSDAVISQPQVQDAGDPDLLRPVVISFDDANTYRIIDSGTGTDLSGPQSYTSGGDIGFQGFNLQISGTPNGGDVFLVMPALAGSGDNTNALALSEIAARGFFNGGELSITGVNANLVANVGSVAARASNELSVQTLLRDQAELELESVAGVNLEEEAVNLLRYQESYLAASKIITVANELFQSLLSAVGR